MTATEFRDADGKVIARESLLTGYANCALCPVQVQRTVTGSLRDGVLQHYRTVHPERKIR